MLFRSAPDDILVLRNAGPKGAPGMPEAGSFPIPMKLARAGVKDMIRISDARMSGTAFGTIVLHVTPEAADGGPLALVRNGDRIRISVRDRQMRHGRKSKSTRVDGYKRHIAVDMDTSLIVAAAAASLDGRGESTARLARATERDRHARRGVRLAAAPLYAGSLVSSADSRPRNRKEACAHRARGRVAEPSKSAVGLSIPQPLPSAVVFEPRACCSVRI